MNNKYENQVNKILGKKKIWSERDVITYTIRMTFQGPKPKTTGRGAIITKPLVLHREKNKKK